MKLRGQIVDFFKKYDFSILATVSAIFIIGVLNLYSAVSSNPSPAMAGLYKTQIGWFSLSLVVAFLVSFIRPKTLSRLTWAVYLVCTVFLILVLVVGQSGMGAQRWLVLGPIRFQPSELMKIALAMALARWFSTRRPDRPLKFFDLIFPGLIALIPAVLVIVEPDLGTGLLLILIFGTVTFYRQLTWKTLGILSFGALLSGSLMYNFGLKDYQKRRILTFIDPYADAKGSGYNAIQSEIAIGSGRILGKGFKKSSQASLQYLPENHTDFVFSVFNEEHGLIGSMFLIALFLILLVRMMWLSTTVLQFYDAVLVVGLMAIFFWHTVINMGMVMGLLPIVGLPLPFMSYGGSSLLTFGICAGMATSISNSRTIF